MATFNPQKLNVTFDKSLQGQASLFPSCYTLTHSDRTGDLILTVGAAYDEKQIAGWYTRLMRDEVLAEWENGNPPTLHLHCHVSGGPGVGSRQVAWGDLPTAYAPGAESTLLRRPGFPGKKSLLPERPYPDPLSCQTENVGRRGRLGPGA